MLRTLKAWRARRKLNRGPANTSPALDTPEKRDEINKLVQSGVSTPGPGVPH